MTDKQHTPHTEINKEDNSKLVAWIGKDELGVQQYIDLSTTPLVILKDKIGSGHEYFIKSITSRFSNFKVVVVGVNETLYSENTFLSHERKYVLSGLYNMIQDKTVLNTKALNEPAIFILIDTNNLQESEITHLKAIIKYRSNLEIYPIFLVDSLTSRFLDVFEEFPKVLHFSVTKIDDERIWGDCMLIDSKNGVSKLHSILIKKE